MVFVTEPQAGRTYVRHHLVLNDHGRRRMKAQLPFNDSSYQDATAEMVVPNGKWVLERKSSGTPTAGLVGPTGGDIDVVCLDYREPMLSFIIISPRPFGVIEVDYRDLHPHIAENVVQKRLIPARLVHKGELGQRPFYDTRGRGRLRTTITGWVQLANLAKITGQDAWTLVYAYWKFSDHAQFRQGKQVGTLVKFRLADSLDDINSGEAERFTYSQNDLGTILAAEPEKFSPDRTWIRVEFALTILRLLALDYVPVMPQTTRA